MGGEELDSWVISGLVLALAGLLHCMLFGEWVGGFVALTVSTVATVATAAGASLASFDSLPPGLPYAAPYATPYAAPPRAGIPAFAPVAPVPEAEEGPVPGGSEEDPEKAGALSQATIRA